MTLTSNPAIARLRVGDAAERAKSVTKSDIAAFADATGDRNPIHLDPDVAATKGFQKCIAHGILISGHISAILGTELPGPGAIYLGQTLKFKAPVFEGDTVTTRVEVVSIRTDKPIVTLRTTCRTQAGALAIDGEAVVLVT
jgi:acyl dehydratase